MARRSIEKFQQMAEKQIETEPDGTMHVHKPKVSQQTWFLIAGAVLMVVAVGLFIYRMSEREKIAVQEHRKAEIIGEEGRQSLGFKLKRVEGIINLPVAQNALDGTARPETTVEIPYEWKDDKPGAREKLRARFAEIAAGLTLDENTQVYTDTVTLKCDRDLPYYFLGRAILDGRNAYFVNFQVACFKSGVSQDVGYLPISLPPEGKGSFLFRMYKEGETFTYAFGTRQVKRFTDLWNATEYLKAAHEAQPDMIVQIAPTEYVPVQHFAEGLNSVVAAGFTNVVIGYTAGLE
jgi:hypothetical protein